MTKFKKYVSILLSVSLIAGVAPMDAQAKTVEDKKAAIQTINEKETMTAQAETGSSETAAPSESPSATPSASASAAPSTTPSVAPTATPVIPSQGKVVVDAEDAFSTTAGSDGKTCTISGYKGNAAVTTLYIPKEMGDKEVTAIAANVFAACPYLKNVVIKNDIDIAAGAFPAGTEVWAKSGAKAQTYAQTNGLTFHPLDSTASLTGKKDASFTKGTLTWTAVNGAASYNVYRKKAKGKYSLYKNVNALTYTNEKLAAGATYTYKIRPVFTAADGESIEGVDSKEAAIALTPAKVKKLKAKGIRGGIQVRWARNKNVTGYQVFMKVHVKGFKTSFNRVKTIKKNKVTGYRCKMLVRGMKYSYRVRAFKTIKGKKIFGPFVMVTAKAK